MASQAAYTPLADGWLKVVNSCRENSLDGPLRSVEGTARPINPADPAKLKVRFGLFAVGDYWIIELTPDYRHAVVGTPNRNSLWILSRMPSIPEALYRELVARAAAQGFDVQRLQKTPQASLEGQ